jgi:hypothetical protein
MQNNSITINLNKKAFSLREVSELTGLSLLYLRQRAGNELKVTRFGRMLRVLDTDLEEFLRNGTPSYSKKSK